MLKHKHIEASREARLWIGQVIVPAVMMGSSLLAIPEVRQAVSDKINAVRDRAKTKTIKFKVVKNEEAP